MIPPFNGAAIDRQKPQRGCEGAKLHGGGPPRSGFGQRPLLMIAGTKAVTAWMSIEAFQKATGPKEFHWIDGASHVDLYDREQYVAPAVDKLAGFFTGNLGKAA